MRLTSFSRLAVAALSTLVPSLARAEDSDNPEGQSTFIAPDNTLAFALTVPEEGSDFFFHLRVKTSRSWGAVGLGSDDMPGALYLMIYQNEKGDNVTFSPRLTNGHHEPKFYEDVQYEALDGTGVQDGWMTLTARCIDCRNWNSNNVANKGYIDVNSPNQHAIYGLGPKEKLRDDSPSAAIRYHESHGVFTIDMKRTRGAADLPIITDESESEGTTLDSQKSGLFDTKSTMHAALMTLAVLVLYPVGIAILRLGRWARWHGANQGIALIVVLAAFGLGVATSFKYQRSIHFTSPHQILGMVVIAFLIAQFCLGFLHHKEFQETNMPTKYGKIHLWLGRGVLFLAVVNLFIGYAFALNRKSGIAIAAVLLAILVGLLVYSIYQQRQAKKRRVAAAFGAAHAHSYGQEPWRQNTDAGADRSTNDSPEYDREPAIGLQSTSPWQKGSGRKSYEDDPDLGAPQRPRDMA